MEKRMWDRNCERLSIGVLPAETDLLCNLTIQLYTMMLYLSSTD